MSEEREGWTGCVRRDGAVALQRDDEPDRWIVLPPLVVGHALLACPCCGAPLRTMLAAQRVADWVWPLEPVT